MERREILKELEVEAKVEDVKYRKSKKEGEKG